MKEKLDKYIKQHHLFKREDKLILAISGGADSVALACLLKALNCNFIMAHCNFGLRKEESDSDEVFVKKLAKKLNVECVTSNFDTQNFATQNKLSIQMAARELRYKWFEALRLKLDCNFIVTAHHQDDDIETFFINLLRGTGIKGMLGIHPKKRNIIRPLLFARKDEIYDFLKENKIEYREDSSNKDDKYLRNKIRLHLIPLLEEINPSIKETITKDMDYLSGISEIYNTQINKQKGRLLKQEGSYFTISIVELEKLNPMPTYLYELLKPFGFFSVNDISIALQKQSGKQFFSSTYRLIIDRKKIIIQPIRKNEKIEIQIDKNDKECFSPIQLGFSLSENLDIQNNVNIAMLDLSKLHFPLVLRKWEKGDFFFPLGMNGKKKLSDFFIDNKISIPEKEQIWVLCSANEIAWIVGLRLDDRFKITEKTKKAYIVQLFKNKNVRNKI
jgi:tRNA(Ile)-lysidine synthase